MRILSFLLFGLLGDLAPLSAQSNYYLPQVIDGLLSTGGSLRTTVLLSNAGATSATLTTPEH